MLGTPPRFYATCLSPLPEAGGQTYFQLATICTSVPASASVIRTSIVRRSWSKARAANVTEIAAVRFAFQPNARLVSR